MADSKLRSEVLSTFDTFDRLNGAVDVDLAPMGEELAALKTLVADRFEDMREQFAEETDDADAATFVECLQNLFEIYWGDLDENITAACKRTNQKAAVASRIHTELLRHVAAVALADPA